jgi:hypothetical protein
MAAGGGDLGEASGVGETMSDDASASRGGVARRAFDAVKETASSITESIGSMIKPSPEGSTS